MTLWWKFPNQSGLASAARWGLASLGVAVLGWSFVAPDNVSEGNETITTDDALSGAGQGAELSQWMKKTSEEGSTGIVLTAALEQVGPWARNQTSADNDVPAQVPSSKASWWGGKR